MRGPLQPRACAGARAVPVMPASLPRHGGCNARGEPVLCTRCPLLGGEEWCRAVTGSTAAQRADPFCAPACSQQPRRCPSLCACSAHMPAGPGAVYVGRHPSRDDLGYAIVNYSAAASATAAMQALDDRVVPRLAGVWPPACGCLPPACCLLFPLGEAMQHSRGQATGSAAVCTDQLRGACRASSSANCTAL